MTTLGGGKKIAPATALRVRGGTYPGTFQVRLAGAGAAPIQGTRAGPAIAIPMTAEFAAFALFREAP